MSRGFGSKNFPRDLHREIAAAGGRAVHALGKAPRFTREQAAEAGRLAQELGTAHRFDSISGKVAGRLGGLARARNLAERRFA
jgi:hypothetical protein